MDNEELFLSLLAKNLQIKDKVLSHLGLLVSSDTKISERDDADYNYIIDMCKYQQQINHKLTQIETDLKKFFSNCKPPSKSPRKKLFRSDEDIMDIETLKARSSELLQKIENFSKYSEVKPRELESNPITPNKTSNIKEENKDDLNEDLMVFEKFNEIEEIPLKVENANQQTFDSPILNVFEEGLNVPDKTGKNIALSLYEQEFSSETEVEMASYDWLENVSPTVREFYYLPAVSDSEADKLIDSSVTEDVTTSNDDPEPEYPVVSTKDSQTDTEKLFELVKARQKTIEDGQLPVYSRVSFSYVETPWEFYLQVDSEETRQLDNLNCYIKEKFSGSKTIYSSKLDCLEKMGDICCAYVKDLKIWVRAEVVDWCLNVPYKFVYCRLMDYGLVKPVHFKHLRAITDELASLPKMAVKCRLPWLYPPGSTKLNLLDEWPESSKKALAELACLKSTPRQFFLVLYSQKDGDTVSIDLCQPNKALTTIGQILIDLGHAEQIVFPEDDPEGIYSFETDIQRAEDCTNIIEALTGYDARDEARICKFTRPDGTCYRGNRCRFEHVTYERGGYTTDLVPGYKGAFNEILLPKTDSTIRIRFTRMVRPTKFYVNLVESAELLDKLIARLNRKSNIARFKSHQVLPSAGEVVLVKHFTGKWMRGLVRHIDWDEDGHGVGAQVFVTDHGDIIDAKLADIKVIEPEYLHLPFQAIECCLSDWTSKNNADLAEFFYGNLIFRDFEARVRNSYDRTLCLEVSYEGGDLGEVLCNMGYVLPIERTIAPGRTLKMPG